MLFPPASFLLASPIRMARSSPPSAGVRSRDYNSVDAASVAGGAVDPQIRPLLQEAERPDALADSQCADVLTRGQFRAFAEEWRAMARRARWDGKPLGPRRAAPPQSWRPRNWG